jgi:glycosyltransferase involved in cell wall biosynthesis
MTAMTPAPVSVVIPTYNSARLVGQAVESALGQTLPPAELIVVDDGSTDDTPRRLAAFGDRVRYVRQTNQGVSAARNHGVRLSKQGFVALLDADDVWHPVKLQLQMDLFAREPDLALVGARMFDWPAPRFPGVDPSRPYGVTRVAWADLVVKNRLSTSSIVGRREALIRAGLFDTDLQGPEDRDLWLRVAEASPVANIELPLMGYRDVPGSVSKQIERCRAGMLRILQKQDERGRWAGRRLLRRKAYSYVHHACAEILTAGGRHAAAAASELRSLAWYPLPYRRSDVTTHAERFKRLAVSLLRAARLKPGHRARPVELDSETPDAIQAARNGLHLQPAE